MRFLFLPTGQKDKEVDAVDLPLNAAAHTAEDVDAAAVVAESREE